MLVRGCCGNGRSSDTNIFPKKKVLYISVYICRYFWHRCLLLSLSHKEESGRLEVATGWLKVSHPIQAVSGCNLWSKSALTFLQQKHFFSSSGFHLKKIHQPPEKIRVPIILFFTPHNGTQPDVRADQLCCIRDTSSSDLCQLWSDYRHNKHWNSICIKIRHVILSGKMQAECY